MERIKKEEYPLLYNEALSLYEKSRADDLTPFPISERRKYYKNGNRNDFEKLYFRRRDYLSSTAILALFDEGYIPELEKIILAICDEYCWALPAHVIGIGFIDKKIIDLFVAETGFVLSEICTVFSDFLSEPLKEKVREETKKRLVRNFSRFRFFWEKKEMNWASVCAGFIGGTLMYLFPEEFNKQKKRILKTLDCYINGFTDDGFCLEGPSYWLYGFFSYSVFADMLYRYSDGKEDLFNREKVKKIAAYGGRCLLSGNTSLSFSDADEGFKPDYALQNLLYGKGLSEPINENRLCFYNANTKWMNYYRAVTWKNDNVPDRVSTKKSIVYSSEANQLIVNNNAFSFAIKSGHNDEPHNHNDLGSFIYADKSGQIFCDLGSGRYTKDYFNEKKRYGIFCNSSLSHSVPIIDGKPQMAGKEFSAVLTLEDNVAVCDISSAYEGLGKGSIVRRAEIKEKGIILTDTFTIGKKAVTERFVSLKKADIKEGALTFGSTKLCYPAEKVTFSLNEEKHTPHEYDSEDITVYCYDFLLKEGVKEITLEITTE
ncbi:MAG: heparinase II/III family protein [Clostridia bacterium]|nr:heparinase II/III family protein [Clostridia bacterium]